MVSIPWFGAAERAVVPKLYKDQERAVWGGVGARHQEVLEESLRVGDVFAMFQNPATFTAVPGGLPYGELVAAAGRRGLTDACQGISLSLLSSFFGRPQAAAPRIGSTRSDVFRTGVYQAMRFLGGGRISFDRGRRPIERQYEKAHRHFAGLGPGTAAYVGIMWHKRDGHDKLYDPDGSPQIDGGHIMVVVYPDYGPDPADDLGPVWYDAQSRTATYGGPPADVVENSAKVEFVVGNQDTVLGAARHRRALEEVLSDGRDGFARYRPPSGRAEPNGPRLHELVHFDSGASGRFGVVGSALAGASCFIGRPAFVAPSRDSHNEDGRPTPDDFLEAYGREAVRKFFGRRLTSLARDNRGGRRTIEEQLDTAYDQVVDRGSGSLGLLVVSGGRPRADTAAFVLVYPRSEEGGDLSPVWWDTMTGARYSHAGMRAVLAGNPDVRELSFVSGTGRCIRDHLAQPWDGGSNGAAPISATGLVREVRGEGGSGNADSGESSNDVELAPESTRDDHSGRRQVPDAGNSEATEPVGLRTDPFRAADLGSPFSRLRGRNPSDRADGDRSSQPALREWTDAELRKIPQPAADRFPQAYGASERPEYQVKLEEALRTSDGKFAQFENPVTFRPIGTNGIITEIDDPDARSDEPRPDGPLPATTPEDTAYVRSGRVWYHGHGRPQRVRPKDWSLLNDFHAPEPAEVQWLPEGAVADNGQGTPEPGAPATVDAPDTGAAGSPDLPDVDKPFTL